MFKRFGFSSGRDVDKFDGFTDYKTAPNGIYYIDKNVNAFLSCEVVNTVDVGTHYMFVALVTDGEILSENQSASYSYYHSSIKPKPQKTENTGKTKWVCRICGYVHEGENLPDDFICPICKHPASDFDKITENNNEGDNNMNLKGSKTEKNLEAAFAGESMARNNNT